MQSSIFRKLPAFLILSTIIISCQKEIVEKRIYSRIATLSVSNIDTQGATFNAEILQLGEMNLTDYGFVWSKDKQPVINSSNKVSLINKTSSGNITHRIITTLEEGVEYYVRAYVSDDKYLTYGNEVSFTSNGSSAPTINYFSPNKGTWLDTITIFGKDFSYLHDENKVNLGKIECEIIENSDSIIKFIVPAIKNELEVELSVSTTGELTKAENVFSYIKNEIISFTPINGCFGDTIFIYGTNFNIINPEFNNVYFNSIKGNIVKVSNNEIVVIVPNEASSYNSISVEVNGIQQSFDSYFSINKPIISEINPKSFYLGENIEIIGDNFNPDPFRNQVYIDDNIASVISTSKNKLLVNVPNTKYSNRTPLIKLIISEQQAQYEGAQLLDKWLNKKSNTPILERDPSHLSSVTINNKAYIVPINYTYDNNMYIYNRLDGSWDIVKMFEGNWRNEGLVFSIGTKIYYGLGYGKSDFWEYDPTSEKWTRKADFPGNSRRCVAFTIENKGYVGAGGGSLGFWEYNPVIDSWTRKADHSGGYDNGDGKLGYSLNGKGYFCLGVTNFVWEYDPINDNWIEKNKFPYVESERNGKVILCNNVAYIAIEQYEKNVIYKHDGLSDTWHEVNVPFNFKINDSFFSFENYIYYWDRNDNMLWEFSSEI